MGKASDVLGDFNVGGGAKLSAALVADLTASIPRDVIASAHQQWLPNLAAEMANRQDAAQTNQQTPPKSAPAAAAPKAAVAQPEVPASNTPPANAKLDSGNKAPAADDRHHNRAPDQADDLLHPTEEELRGMARPGGPAVKGYTAYAGPVGGKAALSANEQSRAVNADIKGAQRVAQADGPARKPGDERPQQKAVDQTDDLLNPTEEELRGMAAPSRGGAKANQPKERLEKPIPQVRSPMAPRLHLPRRTQMRQPPLRRLRSTLSLSRPKGVRP